jgi:hypothetical protein
MPLEAAIAMLAEEAVAPDVRRTEQTAKAA